VADTLSNLEQWAPHLIDLGEQEVKHGVRIQIYNLCTDEAGNREMPRKVAARKAQTSTTHPQKQKKLALIGAVLAAGVLVASGWFFTHRARPEQSSSAAAATPERSFSYSIQVQRYRDGAPYKETFVLPGEMIFEKDYRIRLQITSAQPGFLYILNQGPTTQAGGGGSGGGGGGGGTGGGGVSSYNILFPASGDPAKIDAGQVVKIPAADRDWIVFDEREGVEQLWLVWSAVELPIFEAAKAFGDAKYQGAIADASLAGQIQEFLDQQKGAPPNAVRDDANQRTTVSGNGNVIVRLLRLEHH
jgi:hypothetical protein